MNLDVPLDDATLIKEARAKMMREKKPQFVNPYRNMQFVPEPPKPIVKQMHTVDLMTIAERQRNIGPLLSDNRSAQKEFLKANDCQMAGVDHKSQQVIEWKNYRIANNLSFDFTKADDKMVLRVLKESSVVSEVESSSPEQLLDLSLKDLRASFKLPMEERVARPKMRR